MDEKAKYELVLHFLEQFSVDLGQHCAGLRLVQSHLPAAADQGERDGRELLELLLTGLDDLYGHLQEELSILLYTP